MKKFRGTFFFAIIVALVAGFAIYDYQHADVKNQKRELADRIMGGIQALDISVIDIKSGINTYKLYQEGEGWYVSGTFTDRADIYEIESTLQTLVEQKLESVDSAGLTIDWKKYGLEEPATIITLKLKSGIEETFKVGSVRTIDKMFYFQLGSSDQLFTGSKSWENLLSKTAYNFRNLRILNADRDFKSIEIQSLSPFENVQMIFEQGRWVVKGHSEWILSAKPIQDYLISLRNLKAEFVVSDSSSELELKKFGLDRPLVQLKFQPEDTSSDGLVVSISKINEKYYLHSSSNIPIYEISEANFKSFNRGIEYFRDKKIPFEIVPEDLKTLSVLKLKSGEVLNFQKDLDKWSVIGKDNMVPNSENLNLTLSDLRNLAVLKFSNLEEKILQPIGELKLTYVNDTPEYQFRYGNLQKDSEGNQVYLAQSSLSQQLFFVNKSKIDSIFDRSLVQADQKP